MQVKQGQTWRVREDVPLSSLPHPLCPGDKIRIGKRKDKHTYCMMAEFSLATSQSTRDKAIGIGEVREEAIKKYAELLI